MDALVGPVEQYKERLRAAGIGPDKPLHAVLVTLYETALETRAIVGRGARGLTPDGEQELIQRLVDNAVSVTGQEVERLARRISFRTAMLFGLAGVVLLVAGYAWGYLHGYCDARHGVCSLSNWWKRQI